MKHANISLFVPFGGCPQICSFCNQKTIAGAEKQPTPEELSEKVKQSLSKLDREKYSAEIAFFGGSFTALNREYMCSLLEAVQPALEDPGVSGIRVSTRPDAVEAEVLRLLMYYHVTAVELGAQSMDDRVLKLNRRGHTAEEVRTAARLIRSAGLELGLQMMTGLYGDTDEQALETARELVALRPDTVRIYPTIVLQGTHLEELYRGGEYAPQTLPEAVALSGRLLELFEEARVPVIRLGLHDGTELERERVAGPYHPAFRELCESERFFRRIIDALAGHPKGKWTVEVHPRFLSVAVGQRKSNLNRLQAMGYEVQFRGNPEIARGEFKIL